MKKPSAAEQRVLDQLDQWSSALVVSSRNLLAMMKVAREKYGVSYRRLAKITGYTDVAVRDALMEKKPINSLPRRTNGSA